MKLSLLEKSKALTEEATRKTCYLRCIPQYRRIQPDHQAQRWAILLLKGQWHGVFSAIFNRETKIMAKCYCSYKKCTSNIKRKIPSKILKESGTLIHFKLLFSCLNGKTWKVPSELFKFRAWVPVVSEMISLLFSASLYWHCNFYENGPLLVGFRCCTSVFALFKFWSDSREKWKADRTAERVIFNAKNFC